MKTIEEKMKEYAMFYLKELIEESRDMKNMFKEDVFVSKYISEKLEEQEKDLQEIKEWKHE